MKRTWLIQRLMTPISKERLESDSPLAKAHRVFGGGMLGLTTEMWDVLDPIFEVDYMGAAEFEFGTLPRTLKALVDDHKKLIVGSFTIKAGDYKVSYERESALQKARWAELDTCKQAGVKPRKVSKARKRAAVAEFGPVEDRTIYFICRTEHREGMEEVVRAIAKGDHQLKEGSRFSSALDPRPGDKYDGRYRGWLELDNGFFFFVDEVMWKATRELLGLAEVHHEAAHPA